MKKKLLLSVSALLILSCEKEDFIEKEIIQKENLAKKFNDLK